MNNRNKIGQVHTLQVGEEVLLTINAKDKFSLDKLAVTTEQVFEFTCHKKQRWKDWYMTSDPDGFFNLFAWLIGLRVKGVKCFCVCGAYNDVDKGAFAIGSKKSVQIEETGTLSFFANDAHGHYRNNSGSVELRVKRKE